MKNLQNTEYKNFEDIKNIRKDSTEFWYARDLFPVLQYAQWKNFIKVIDKAMTACKNSGHTVSDHFSEVGKTILMPKNAQKAVKDYELSRYACYLIVQNGDPKKEVIALAQTYFAIQTRKQELSE